MSLFIVRFLRIYLGNVGSFDAISGQEVNRSGTAWLSFIFSFIPCVKADFQSVDFPSGRKFYCLRGKRSL